MDTNETMRVDMRGHVFFTRKLNDEYVLLATADDLMKSAMIELNKYYENVVDLAYDGEDAEYEYIDENGESFFGEDADGITLFFIRRDMLNFRFCPGCGAIGFMVNKDLAKLKEDVVEESMMKQVNEVHEEPAMIGEAVEWEEDTENE